MTLDSVVTLGEAEGAAIIESTRTSAHFGVDSIFYVFENLGSRIKMFSIDGEYLRTIGRAGQGPGEFQGISAIRTTRDDEVLVFDMMARRLTRFHSPNDSISTLRLPFPPQFGVEVLADGSIIAASHVRTPERIGFPLQLLTEEGDWRSFGSSGEFRPEMLYDNDRAISLGRDGNVWVAFRDRYVIEKWSPEGEKLLEVERPVDWLPRQTTSRRLPDAPPPQMVGQIQAIEDGRLWVVLTVADPDWRDAWVEGGGGPHGDQSIDDIDVYYDTVVELIDTRSASVLASQRFDRVLGGFVGPGLISEVVQDPLGIPYLAIQRLTAPR